MAFKDIVPGLRYDNAHAAIDFLCTVFGFEKIIVVPGEGDIIEHAQLKRDNCMIMLGSVRDDAYGKGLKTPKALEGINTQAPYFIIDEIEEFFEQVKNGGAEIVLELTEQDYGGKLFICKDTEGYIWNFGTYDPWNVE